MKYLFFIFSIVLLLSCPIFTVPADIEKLSGPDYFPAVHKALSEAKQSIFVVMYYVDFQKDEPESKVSILMSDLVKAKDRGVKIKIILDQTVII